MKSGNAVKINRATMAFIDRATGIVQYQWAALDTDASGTYNVEVEIDWGATEFQTFPSTGYFAVQVNDDLG